MKIFSSVRSLFFSCALLFMTSNFDMVEAQTTIFIVPAIGPTTTFNAAIPGQSRIEVFYSMDGATLDTRNSNSDFYVLQYLQDGDTCATSSSLPFVSLTSMEPTLAGSQSTTFLQNLAAWPDGSTKICLRMQLMLRMFNSPNDQLWHQMDFKITVMVSYATGSTEVTYSGNDIAESGIYQNPGLQGGTGTSSGVSPEFFAAVENGGTAFRYKQIVPINVFFVHPLDIFSYSVNANGVIPVQDASGTTQLSINGNPVEFPTKAFYPNFNFASRTIGRLEITLPLVLYRDAAVNTVKIKIPISWVKKTVTPAFRALASESSGNYTGPTSGVDDKVVEIELEPYTDESGSIAGFTINSIASTICVVGTTLLM